MESESESGSAVFDSWWLHGLYSLWNSPGQNTGVGSLSLLQGIFPTQGSNPSLPHCRQFLYQLSHKGSPPLDGREYQSHILRVCENGDTVTAIISDYGFVYFSWYLLGFFVLFSVFWDCMIRCLGLFFFFCPTTQHVGILVPWSGIEPMPPAVEAQSSDQWTAREFP